MPLNRLAGEPSLPSLGLGEVSSTVAPDTSGLDLGELLGNNNLASLDPNLLKCLLSPGRRESLPSLGGNNAMIQQPFPPTFLQGNGRDVRNPNSFQQDSSSSSSSKPQASAETKDDSTSTGSNFASV